MNQALNRILTGIGEAHRHHISRDKARNYLEVNIGQAADRMGIAGLSARMRAADVIVPLRGPVPGMKVALTGGPLWTMPGLTRG